MRMHRSDRGSCSLLSTAPPRLRVGEAQPKRGSTQPVILKNSVAGRSPAEAVPHSPGGDLRPRLESEPVENALHVVFRGAFADDQALSNVTVGQALRDEVRHFSLPRAQAGQRKGNRLRGFREWARGGRPGTQPTQRSDHPGRQWSRAQVVGDEQCLAQPRDIITFSQCESPFVGAAKLAPEIRRASPIAGDLARKRLGRARTGRGVARAPQPECKLTYQPRLLPRHRELEYRAHLGAYGRGVFGPPRQLRACGPHRSEILQLVCRLRELESLIERGLRASVALARPDPAHGQQCRDGRVISPLNAPRYRSCSRDGRLPVTLVDLDQAPPRQEAILPAVQVAVGTE